MALPPFTVRAPARPAKPATGGHYVNVGGNSWRQIHATGPGKWAPGPPATPAATKPKPAANPFANPLYDPSQVLSGKPLYRAVQAETNLQYDPAINQLTQQIAQNTRQGAAAQGATAGYFNTLGQYGQEAANRVNAIGQGLNTTLQGIGQGTQSALDKYGQQAATPALQSLAGQGLGAGAAEQLAAVLASQKSLAGQNAAADQAYGAKVGANASTLAAQSLGTYALRGQERIGQVGAATRLAQQPVETKLATTRTEKNAAFGTNLMAARAAERSYGVAKAGLGIKSDAIKSAAATAAAGVTSREKIAAGTQTGANTRNQANIDARALQGGLDRKSREGIAAADRATRQAIASGKTAAAANKPASPAAQRTMWNSITAVQGRVRWLTNWIQQQTGASLDVARNQAWHGLNSGRLYVPYDAVVRDPATGKPLLDKNGNNQTTRKWKYTNIPPVGNTPLLNAAYNSAVGNGLQPGDVAYLHSIGFTIGNLMPIRDLTNQGLGPH